MDTTVAVQICKEYDFSSGKMIPPFINSLAKIILVRNPHFNNKKCIRCGKCVQICPA